MAENDKAENSVKIREILEELIAKPIPDMEDADFELKFDTKAFSQRQRLGMSYIQLIVHQLVERAASGDKAAIQTVFDRLMGKAKPAKDVTGDQDDTYTGWLGALAAQEAANPTPELSDDEIDAEFR